MSAVTLPGGDESVLLAAPDPETRVLLAFMLRRLGYRVTEARSGLDALRASEESGEFDLLLADALASRMNGNDLAERLRERRPDLRVLLLADAAYARAERRAASQRRLRFLARPFTVASLAAAVREALDAAWTATASGRA